MQSHSLPVVPAPRSGDESAPTPIESLLRARRRVAMTLARAAINPLGRTELSERAGSLLDARPQ